MSSVVWFFFYSRHFSYLQINMSSYLANLDNNIYNHTIIQSDLTWLPLHMVDTLRPCGTSLTRTTWTTHSIIVATSITLLSTCLFLLGSRRQQHWGQLDIPGVPGLQQRPLGPFLTAGSGLRPRVVLQEQSQVNIHYLLAGPSQTKSSKHRL